MDLSISYLAGALRDYLPPEEIQRHELTNREWALVRDVIPLPANRRGQPRDRRQVLNGMLWLLRTGAPWRDLPARYGPYQTVWRNFSEWRQSGVLEAIKKRLIEHLNDAGQLDWDLWCVDGTSVRATRAAVGGSKGGGTQKSRATTRSAGREEAGEPKSTS